MKTTFINVNLKSMPVGKMTTKKVAVKSGSGGKTMMSKSTTTTKRNIPVNDATRKKYTDTQKKAAAIKGGVGVKVAPKGTSMRKAQDASAKTKVDDFYKRNGVMPTPENWKKGYR